MTKAQWNNSNSGAETSSDLIEDYPSLFRTMAYTHLIFVSVVLLFPVKHPFIVASVVTGCSCIFFFWSFRFKGRATTLVWTRYLTVVIVYAEFFIAILINGSHALSVVPFIMAVTYFFVPIMHLRHALATLGVIVIIPLCFNRDIDHSLWWRLLVFGGGVAIFYEIALCKIAKSVRSINEINEKLNESQAQLQTVAKKERESNIAKDVFLANVSHEIRTPLNGLYGSLQLLKKLSWRKNVRYTKRVLGITGTPSPH